MKNPDRAKPAIAKTPQQQHKAARKLAEENVGQPLFAAHLDTALLYSVHDVAVLAQVSKAVVVKLCLAGEMPDWIEVEGRRYWPRAAAVDAVAEAIYAAAREKPRRKSA